MRTVNLRWIGGVLIGITALAGCGADVSDAQNEDVRAHDQALTCAGAPWLSTYFGNAVIHNQAEADAFACYTRITGSLTIADSEAFAIALPNLRTVLGDVHIVYSSDDDSLPFLERKVRSVSLPQLTRIVGHVELSYPGENGGFYAATQNLGLEALTTLIGNLSVEIDNFGANLDGLSSLTRLDGSLSLWVRTGDVEGYGFLDNLRLVTGHVHLREGGNSFGLLRGLETVLGSLTVQGFSFAVGGPPNFSALRTVGHNVELRNVELTGLGEGARLFPELSFVGGWLDVEHAPVMLGDGEHNELVIARLDVRLLGLRLVDTEFAVFGAFDPRLFAFGLIDLRDNALMCEASAAGFIASERAQGFFGLATQSANGAGATCP